jgi:hypothetical protein
VEQPKQGLDWAEQELGVRNSPSGLSHMSRLEAVAICCFFKNVDKFASSAAAHFCWFIPWSFFVVILT